MMNKIKKLTEVIRDCSECELDYGTLRTLKMIDDESEKMDEMLDALRRAKIFIENGIEYGYIKMPEMETDEANKTPGIINQAIERATRR
jgi:hypothetical protein